jgi:hypothetical protein
VIDRFNDERLRRKEQALCAAYLSLLSLKNRELEMREGIYLINNGGCFQKVLRFF